MNPIALYFASGESLYAGAILLTIIVLAGRRVRHRWPLRLRALLLWIGIALIIMAAVPMSWVTALTGVIVFAAWFMAGLFPPETAPRGALSIASALLVGWLAAVCGDELRYRTLPAAPKVQANRLTIIGDSISAGIAGDASRWPYLYQRDTGTAVNNLSRPGDQVADALDSTKKLTPEDTLLLIEIGGNDLIAGVSAAQFERDLNALLERCARPGRTLIMFELPLLPHRTGYGRAQRRLAAQYGVTVIPKRFFVEVLRAGTSDGLHLSPEGAQTMVALVRRILPPETR